MVDFDFYRLTYFGDNITDEDVFKKYESIASDDVNSLTGWQINESNLSDQVKKAICVQVDFLFENGITQNNSTYVNIGKFGYSKSPVKNAGHYDKRVRSILEYTGLLNRGVSLC